ncbi:MAG: ADP-ribosylglycohydrolase family protein [Acidiferrobacter sp.]
MNDGTSQSAPTVQSRFRGCLLGGAAGDALGAPVEFFSLSEITREYGAPGIRDFSPCYGRVGAITDDSQMTLFTAEGLIRAAVRYDSRGICHPASVVHHAYLRWLRTQGEASGVDVKETGWLIGAKALWARRAPGSTCISALKEATAFGTPARNDSKGCGGVMRVAPVGLICPPEQAFKLGAETAELTHGHPTSSCSAGFLAALVALIVGGSALTEAVEAAKALLRSREHHAETLWAIENAQSLARSGSPNANRLESLGAGWIAEEALAIALYSVLATSNLEEAVCLAINHSGDSDSTGAIAGNIAGTLYGVEAVPDRWLAPLELREEITTLADDLWACAAGTLNLASKSTWSRYPGG